MDIKINNHLAQWLKDYSIQNGAAPLTAKTPTASDLEQLRSSIDLVNHVTENSAYKTKLEQITAQINEQRYDMDIEGLIDQLLAFEGFI